jgi:hypothetical protein
MQAVVRAARAQAAEEHDAADEQRRERPVKQSQAVARPLRSLPRRTRATNNGRTLPPRTVPTVRPLSSPVGWSNADDDTSPLPRLTASGQIATTDVDDLGTRPEHPRPRAPDAALRRRYRPATLIAAALVVVAGGALAVALFSNGTKPAARASTAAAPGQVAAWVADQVSPTAAVACDPAMCRALSAKGVDRLVVLGSTASNILHSQLIIATAAVRRELGARLGSIYAPAVIASFGSGDARIDIRVVAPYGPAAFRAALDTDLQNRKQDAAALLSSTRVLASGLARRELLSGQVSAQLLIVFTNMAALHPIDILAFGDQGPGASAEIPLRSAELSESDGAADVQKWLSFLGGQKYPFLPALTKTVRLDGKPVLLIQYAAPCPLGLLASS